MTKKMLPSPAQMRVLEAMRDGATIKRHLSASNCVDHVRLEPCTEKTTHPASQTFTSMRLAGWIAEDVRAGAPDWWETWTLTNLGRHALEAARASKGEG